MKKILVILFFFLIYSCKKNEIPIKKTYTSKQIFFGFDFKNEEVNSIEIIDSSDFVLNGKYKLIDVADPEDYNLNRKHKPKKLTENEKLRFLNDLENLKEEGNVHCSPKHIVQLNLKNNTLYLKFSGNLVANRISGLYLKSSEKNCFDKYLK